MASASIDQALAPSTGEVLFACVEAQGSAAHPYGRSLALLRTAQSSRSLADAVHFLCTVHGRRPGVVDHAAGRSTQPAARAWLASALEGFSGERAFLARLAVEAGPVPSTPGAAGAEAALVSQRHALQMLALSERNGCALGAAMALVADWGAIRPVLDAAAVRFEVAVPSFRLGARDAIRSLADALGAEPLVERAILFGAQQVLLQHHGLWHILEARQLAREAR
jgi:hypothetical protein